MAWKLTGDEKVMAEINITPLTDVMLVLLVIFMVTTPLLMMDSFKLNLPKAITADAEIGQAVIVTITREGLVYVDKRPLAMESLDDELKKELGKRKETTVLVKADRLTRHGMVVEVLDNARRAGATRLSIATEPTDEKR